MSPIVTPKFASISLTSTFAPCRLISGDIRAEEAAAARGSRVFVQCHDGGAASLNDERQCVMHGARGFTATIPGDHHVRAGGREVAGIRHHQYGPPGGHDEVFLKVVADIRFGILQVILSRNDQIRAADVSPHGEFGY
jgi:hypothetical protein